MATPGNLVDARLEPRDVVERDPGRQRDTGRSRHLPLTMVGRRHTMAYGVGNSW